MQNQSETATGRGELAKTLDGEFDEYAVLLRMCLGRIERDVNGRVVELEKEKIVAKAKVGLKTSLRSSYRETPDEPDHNELPGEGGAMNATGSRLFITNAGGNLQDVSHRRAMGAQPDELLHSRDAFLHRTDVIVARSALVRLASEAARLADSMRESTASNAVLQSHCDDQQAVIVQQSKRVQFLENMLEQALSSVSDKMKTLGEAGSAAESSDLAWAHHFTSGRVAVDEGEDRFKVAYEEWQRRMEEVGSLDGEVAERSGMLSHYRDKVNAIVGTATEVGEEALDHSPSTFARPISPTTQRNLDEQHRQADLHVSNLVQRTAQTKVTTLDTVKGMLKEADRPVQFTADHEEEHYIIRRDINSKGRVVRKQGASASIVGRIVTAILYAPASALHLQVCMDSTTGRRHQLQRQATESNFTEVWEELLKYPNPYLQLINISGERHVEDGLDGGAGGRDIRDLVVDDDGNVEEFEERRVQREKRQAFRRLNEGLLNSRKGFEIRKGTNDEDDGKTITSQAVASPHIRGGAEPSGPPLQQRPGLIHFVATDCGKRPWSNPVSSGAIRVAVSSVLPPAKVEAILTPYLDPRSSYFSTRNAPGQYISVTFDRMVVVPTAYSLASTHPISGGEYPRSWRLEASCDGIQWTCLRRHTNDESLSKHTPTCTWSLERSSQNSTFFTTFRVVAEGPNIAGGDALCATCFEIYGKVAYVVENPFPSLQPASTPTPRPSGFATMGGMPAVREPKKGVKKKKK